MPIDQYIQAWRRVRNLSIVALANKAGFTSDMLESLEKGERDPSVSILESLAVVLEVPPSWLFCHPNDIKVLFADLEDESQERLMRGQCDPVTTCVLLGSSKNRELYVLLTALVQNGDPKLLRVAEVNLRSLVKQSRTATVPWQTRLPGHFEPPSD